MQTINVDSLYKGMKTLLDNPKLREEVSRNGKRMVYDLYDINKVADKMIKMYEEAINSR
jgi:glycosyltransferase involved in cell wall biosynthesis